MKQFWTLSIAFSSFLHAVLFFALPYVRSSTDNLITSQSKLVPLNLNISTSSLSLEKPKENILPLASLIFKAQEPLPHRSNDDLMQQNLSSVPLSQAHPYLGEKSKGKKKNNKTSRKGSNPQESIFEPSSPKDSFSSSSPSFTLSPKWRETPIQYPRKAQEKGLEGTVKLHLSIDSQGFVKGTQLVKSSGHPLLDSAALRSAKAWVMEPKIQDGKPVACLAEVDIPFILQR